MNETLTPQTQYPAPPPVKKPIGFMKGCGIAIAAFFGLMVLVAIFSPDDSTTPTTSNGSTASQQSAPVETPAATKWVKVATYTGSGMKKTPTFDVGNEWKITWDTKPGSMGDGNFCISVYKPGSELPEDMVANVMGADTDESYQHSAGTFYLDILASQQYTIEVWNKQ